MGNARSPRIKDAEIQASLKKVGRRRRRGSRTNNHGGGW
jgi:hypothetical protein